MLNLTRGLVRLLAAVLRGRRLTVDSGTYRIDAVEACERNGTLVLEARPVKPGPALRFEVRIRAC